MKKKPTPGTLSERQLRSMLNELMKTLRVRGIKASDRVALHLEATRLQNEIQAAAKRKHGPSEAITPTGKSGPPEETAEEKAERMRKRQGRMAA
jgi:hypothetical protein